MARSIALIKSQLVEAKQAEASLSGLTSTSQTAVWNLWLYINAVAINVFEQLQDAFKIELEGIAKYAIPNTDAWVQNKTLQFQYDATNTQVIQLVDLVPTYPTIIPAYQIISRCSVYTDYNRICQIKVAKNNPPVALSGGELTALQSYWGVCGNAGLEYNIISATSDKVEIVASVYYDAQYQAVIQASVNQALTNFLASLPFDGILSVSKIEDVLQAVSGVKDIKLQAINCRRNSASYGTGTVLFNLSTGTNALNYLTYAGYIVEEDTASHTFTDTITYIAQ